MREEDKKRILEETKDMSPFEVLGISDTKEFGSEEANFYIQIHNDKMATSIQKDLDEDVANGGYYWRKLEDDKYARITKEGTTIYTEEKYWEKVQEENRR